MFPNYYMNNFFQQFVSIIFVQNQVTSYLLYDWFFQILKFGKQCRLAIEVIEKRHHAMECIVRLEYFFEEIIKDNLLNNY